MKSIISIGRQYGCGGREICNALSEKLGIPFYDRELIDYAANKSGIDPDVLAKYDEKATNSLLYSLSIGSYHYLGTPLGSQSLPLNDQLFISQSEVIKQLADKGPCIILGRCSDYVLRNEENLVSVFVRAGIDFRTERIMKSCDMKEKPALDYILKTDKRRSSFYNFYTNRIWGSVDNYDISVNTERVDIDGAAQVIVDYVKQIKHPNPKESEIY